MSAVEDFVQYQLRFVDDIQHDYAVIRPIVLFAETIVVYLSLAESSLT